MKGKPINFKTYVPKEYIAFNKLKIGDWFVYSGEKYKKVGRNESRSLDGGGIMILVDISTSVGKIPKKSE